MDRAIFCKSITKITSQEPEKQVKKPKDQNQELAKDFAVMGECMKTLQSDLHGTLERFRADSVDFKSEMARRENRPLIAMLGDAIDLVMHDHMCTFQQAL
ncbi:MAG: hypothetical protein OXE41_05225, partial [Gammaproteobacteria bacterium]|nr:hypothetical protein [Gammaproteobacteria bacterium]